MEKDSPPFDEAFAVGSDIVGTAAFSSFVTEFRANMDLFFFVTSIVSRADKIRVAAAKALLPLSDEDKKQELLETIDNPNQTMKSLNKHANVLSANLINGLVSSFQRYFSLIIQQTALKKPSILRSSQQIRVDDVLKFSRHRELVRFIVDRKVNDLSYGGLGELEKFLSDRLGIIMFEDDRARTLMKLMNEVRNINVHNGGIVNELFESRVGSVDGFPYTAGKRFYLDFDEITILVHNAMQVVRNLDAAIASKFGLRRQLHTRWTRGQKSIK